MRLNTTTSTLNSSSVLDSPGHSSIRVDSQVCPVHVLVRCRPLNEKEKSHGISIKTSEITRRSVTVQQKLVHGKEISKMFSFDQVFGPVSSQVELFNTSIKPIVNEVLEGFSCTIFAYGQTSTGKTFTMEGARNSKTNEIIETQAGVIPRSVAHIFETLEKHKSEYTVKLSCLELYNEELQDLLSADPPMPNNGQASKDSGSKLKIFDDSSKGTSVHGAEEVVVQDTAHVMKVLDQATKKRQIAETQLNKQSSRSHAITTITIHIRDQTPDGEEFIKTGKLNLVDLAGSENIGRSGAQNKRAKEAGMINQSLLTLGRVITALTEKCPHVPYRESKLTRLLQDSLGGRTKTCIIATISPSVLCLEETLSTLDYANRAKSIKNKPELNMKISKGAMIKEMASECEQLRQMLSMQRSRSGGVFLSNDQYEEKEKLIKNQEDKLDSMKTEMEILKREVEATLDRLNEEQGLLKMEREEHNQTRNELDNARSCIEKNERDIADLQDQLLETRYVLDKKGQNEQQLYTEAQSLLSSLRESETDIAALVDSIANQRTIHQDNESTISTTGDKLTKQVLEVIESLEQFRKSYHKISSTDFQEHMSKFKEAQSTAFDSLLNKHFVELTEQYIVTKDKISNLVDKFVSASKENGDTSTEEQKKFEEMISECVNANLNISQKSLKNIQNQLLEHHNQGADWMKNYVNDVIFAQSKQMMEKYTTDQKGLALETLKRVNENTSAQLKSLEQYKNMFLELSSKQQLNNAQMKKSLLTKMEKLVDECVSVNNQELQGVVQSVGKGLSHMNEQIGDFRTSFTADHDSAQQRLSLFMSEMFSASQQQIKEVEEKYLAVNRMKDENLTAVNMLSNTLSSQAEKQMEFNKTQSTRFGKLLQGHIESVNDLRVDSQLVHDRHSRVFADCMTATKQTIENLDSNVISSMITALNENNSNANSIYSRSFTASSDSHKQIHATILEMRENWKANTKTESTPRKRKRSDIDSVTAIRTYDEITRERMTQMQADCPIETNLVSLPTMSEECDTMSDDLLMEDQENQAPPSPNVMPAKTSLAGTQKPVFGPHKPSTTSNTGGLKKPNLAITFSPQNGKRRKKISSMSGTTATLGRPLHRSSSSQFR